MHDPEKGFKGSKDGLEFYVEHHPWKRLPAEVFATQGGKDAAKEQRLVLRKKDSTTADKDTQPTASQPDQTNKARDIVTNEQKTDEMEEDQGITNKKKRLLSEMENENVQTSSKIFDTAALLNVPRLLPPTRHYPTGRTFTTPHFVWISLDAKNK